MKSNLWAVILAGGKGTRLFPISHPGRPKQFCMMDGQNTFVQSVIDNLKQVGVEPHHIIIVVTDDIQKQLAEEQCLSRGIISPNIIKMKPELGYAGCMVSAAMKIRGKDKDAIIINTPSDQYIKLNYEFHVAMQRAINVATSGNAAIVGVKATDLVAAMGCGHAIYNRSSQESGCYKLKSFVEKPDKKTAEALMRNGESVMNTGINVWPAGLIANTFAGENHAGIGTDELMRALESKLMVSVGAFEWYDCGTLKSLYHISAKGPGKNVRLGKGEIESYKCRSSLCYAGQGINLRITGAEDVAVVATSIGKQLVIVVTKLDDSQKIKFLAEDYFAHQGILSQDFSLDAHNNVTMPSNFESGDIAVGFVGVDGYMVYPYHESSGDIMVAVSRFVSAP